MIQLEQSLNHQTKLTPLLKNESTFRGLFIAIFIISVWAISFFFLLLVDISKLKFWMLCALMPWQTFLYTGLFITSHDAMHGVVFPRNPKVNHLIGKLSLSFYGLLPYEKLLEKHWLHHRNPATQTDPDFHDGKHRSFFAWYFHFMKNYWSWRQIIAITFSYQFANLILHIPHENLILFWVIPSLLSSLQLFYFGTFIPHSEPIRGYVQPHCAETIDCPVWLSFLTCYHFGYHKEHHENLHLPWWRLPEVYQKG